MSKHYYCCALLALMAGPLSYAQSAWADAKPGQGNRSDIVKVVSDAAPGVQPVDQAPASSSGRALGTTKTYAADVLNADWKTESGSFACLLSHQIDGFGKAVFSRKTGSGEVFYLSPQGAVVFPRGIASMDTLPPAWRSGQAPLHLGTSVAVAGERPLRLNPAEFAPLVDQLSSDMKVMFTSAAAEDSGARASPTMSSGMLRVVLDPKNFAKAYKAYQHCMGVLVPYTFSQVALISLNYAAKAEGLNASHKTELNKVARYVKADPEVLGVLIDAHSDNSGSAEENELISKQESEWVSAYLVLQGVDSSKITTRWHGDKFPMASNDTEGGRSKNRRVTVRLENESTRRDAEQKAQLRMAMAEREALKAAAEEQKKQALAAQEEERKRLEAEREAEQKKLAAEQEEVQKKLAAERRKARSSARPEHISTKMAPRQSSQGASSGKVTPEQIGEMVNGLELIPKQ